MIETRQLKNGARALVEEIPHVRSAAVGVFVKVGSRHESETNNGISHFIEHMLFKGTRTRSAREIAEVFEEMGGQLNAYTAKEYTCFYARVLDENLFQAMDILFDMLFDSVFDDKDLATERGVIIEEINMYEDSPDEQVHDVFSQTILAGHSLGRPILGQLQTVTGLAPATIRQFYRAKYHPSNMVIALAGNLKAEEVFARLEGYSGFEAAETMREEDIVPRVNQGINLVSKETEQVQICIGVPSISYHDEQRYTQNIMNSILGGGISSRLFQTIREEKGLAYSIYSYPATFKDVGTYAIYVGTSPNKIGEFFTILKEQLTRFVEEGVTEEEVKRAQNQIKASLYMGMESIMARMNRLGKAELYYGQVPSLEQMIEKVFMVTPLMVKEFAQKTLGSGKFSLASIGEASILPEVEENFRTLIM
jgi:predicted Zn-dependent peptidase